MSDFTLPGSRSVSRTSSTMAIGTSGGIPYYSAAPNRLKSSALLGTNNLVIGGGAGAAPSTDSAWTIASHVLTGTSSGTISMAATGANITLTNGTSNWIQWPNAGIAAPAFTTRSTGTRLVLYPIIDASHADYAIGIESGTMWHSIPDSTSQYKWYAGTTNVMKLTGTGVLTMSGTTQAILEVGSSLLSTGDCLIRIGPNRTGSANAYIDFYADSSGSQTARILRNTGANGDLSTYNYGTGNWNAVYNTQFKWYGNTTTPTEVARMDTAGNFVCNAYWFNSTAAVGLAFRATNYHYFLDYDGNNALYLGGSGDKSNYYRNSIHQFQNIGGSVSYIVLNAIAGLNQYYNGENRFYSAAGVVQSSINNSSGIYSTTDNLVPCGFSGLRWTAVWAVNGAIQTSDATAKQIADAPISDAEMRAVSKVKPKLFRMTDQVAKKGDSARWHYGYVAQDFIEAYEAEGLDPWKHGAFCRDVIGEGGKRFTVAAQHEHHHTPPTEDDGIEREYQLSLRYDQCLVLQIEALNRRVAELEHKENAK